MIRQICAMAIATLMMTSATHAQSASQEDVIERMGAYVASGDLGRTEAFYKKLLARDPVIRLEHFIAFDVSGGWFAIVSRDKYAPGSVPGSGAVPYIQVSDLETLRKRVPAEGPGPRPQIIEEPGIKLLKLKDPDGQLVEFFSLDAE